MTNNGGFNWIERPAAALFPGTQAADYKGGSIQVVDPETGKFETLYDSCDGRKLRGPNDLVFDDAGGFWFTDLGKTRERDNDRGAVYYAKADGSMIEEEIFPLERPNGIGLSPDEQDALRGRDADRALLGLRALGARARSSRPTAPIAARRAAWSRGSAATRCSIRWPSTARATSAWPR